MDRTERKLTERTQKTEADRAKREIKSTRKERTEIGEEGRCSTRKAVRIPRRDASRSEVEDSEYGSRRRTTGARSGEESCEKYEMS